MINNDKNIKNGIIEKRDDNNRIEDDRGMVKNQEIG